ncbi:hypothetical protein PIROE2DRAFT_58823 [Piromyces sp. E2]|nr:hypothetical protein PIROE2DRAFT_58823 [Piromyces sp. E2]|eukprot:OUM67349.1 hypothetical protein PIROE2DRAFT_58823 [Piromyces sp. E2]
MKFIYGILVLFINLAITLAGTVYKVTAQYALNIRQSPNANSKIVDTLKKNDYIYVTSVSNGWAKFYKGYCSADYLVAVNGNANYVTNSGLNFRTGPSTSYSIVTTLRNGSDVVLYGNDPFISDWGVTNNGYCNVKYLTAKSNSNNIPEASINIITTPLKQSNYPNTYTTGCTISKYGCCVTSITMALNQIQNKNYSPYDVAKKMTFSGCGANHSSFTNLGFKIVNKPTLQDVLNGLLAGNIVPYGAKTGSNQHWVAVYGYTGDYKNLKSSDFLIHDPGLDRDTLSEYLKVYKDPYMALIYNN